MISSVNSVFFILLLSVSSSIAEFSFSDCGVQLSRNIHYQSASISPSVVGNGSLSINVQATIVNTLYSARTRVVVTKDEQVYLDVYIQDLCSIIATTKSLSCPLQPGVISFTYVFENIPDVPTGTYDIAIRSILNNQEVGCLALSGQVVGLNDQTCHYSSSFSTSIDGTVQYEESDPTTRQIGQWIHVGPIGTDDPYGTFVGSLQASADLGGVRDLSNYVWSLNGTLQSISNNNSSGLLQTFAGDFTVLYNASGVLSNAFSGQFNWILNINAQRTPTQIFSGTFWLSPQYVYNPTLYAYPVVLGNAGPFLVKQLADRSFSVTGGKTYCTCAYDSCGVCGGDGSTCTSLTLNRRTGLTSRDKAAIAIGAIGGVVGIVVVAVLSHMIVKAKKSRPHDDSDLIDHPQKPDYGTMAIDDEIRQNEHDFH